MEIPGIGPATVSLEQDSRHGDGRRPHKHRNSRMQRTHFMVVRHMLEAGVKLRVQAVPLATAARIYHTFFSQCDACDFDPHLVAMTSLYLAGKVEEQHLKLRDVINVCYRCVHRDKAPLDIGATYWALRDSVTQCELYVLRVLKFQVNFKHPHKYLLHYLKSVTDWLAPVDIDGAPVARTAWALLRDSYHSDLCLRHTADQLAVAVLYLALQCHGVTVPHSHSGEYTWWEALVEDISIHDIRRLVTDIIDVYNMETTVAS